MKKSSFQQFPRGTTDWVLAHAAWQASRGRGPSEPFDGVLNPEAAVRYAYASKWGSWFIDFDDGEYCFPGSFRRIGPDLYAFNPKPDQDVGTILHVAQNLAKVVKGTVEYSCHPGMTMRVDRSSNWSIMMYTYCRRLHRGELGVVGPDPLPDPTPVQLRGPFSWYQEFMPGTLIGDKPSNAYTAEAWATLMQEAMRAGVQLEDVAAPAWHAVSDAGISYHRGKPLKNAVHILVNSWVHGERLRIWWNQQCPEDTHMEYFSIAPPRWIS